MTSLSEFTQAYRLIDQPVFLAIDDQYLLFAVRNMLHEYNVVVLSDDHPDALLITDNHKAIGPRTILIVDNSFAKYRIAFNAYLAGNLVAVISRDEPSQLQCVLNAHALGMSTMSTEIIKTLADAPPFEDRTTLILQGVSEGRSNSTIARMLCLSEATVKREVSRLFRLLRCKTRIELASKARQMGF